MDKETFDDLIGIHDFEHEEVFYLPLYLKRASAKSNHIVVTLIQDEGEYKSDLVYEGNNCYDEWYLKQGANLYPYNKIRFENKTTLEVYELDTWSSEEEEGK